MNTTIALFDQFPIRRHFDSKTNKWYFSVIDIVAVLTEQVDIQKSRNYWKVLKHRLIEEGSEVVTNCNQLKMIAEDGKMRLTDVADNLQSQGFEENKTPAKIGGKIAKNARQELESKTGKKVIGGDNFLKPKKSLN